MSRPTPLAFIPLLLVVAQASLAQAPDASKAELRRELQRVLDEGRTVGASVAVVRRGGPAWTIGLGTADVATRQAATAQTLFRIGSISKQFVSLAVLRLVERGRLSLDDPIRALVPDVQFENAWESTDPIRVVHLLEHTTGWDDIGLRGYARDGADMSLDTALAFEASSRVSRWRPGTRMSYSNAGPAVAAYIVETLTGERFEDVVSRQLFAPLGMHSATYFPPPAASAATSYHDDGTTPHPYWHMLYRPSGAINASAEDMAAYVQFLLHRGASEGAQVIGAHSLDRMRMPQSTWAARSGLTTGHGLTTASLIREGFVWHGHSGSVMGGLSELWYLPEHGVGYFTSINSDNEFDSFRMGQAIRRHLTRGLASPSVPAATGLPDTAGGFAGWYEPASPRLQLVHFLDRLRGLAFVRFEGRTLIYRSLDEARTYVPVGGTRFRRTFSSDPQDPVPTLTLLQTDEGRFLQLGTSTETVKRLPAWLAVLQLMLLVYVACSVVVALIYPAFSLATGFVRRPALPGERVVHAGLLLPVLALIAAAGLLASASDDPIARLGHATVWSVGLWLATLVFAVSVVANVALIWRTPPAAVRPRVRRFAAIVTGGLLIATGYLGYWGIIGLRTWA